jgi:hypothetical protein
MGIEPPTSAKWGTLGPSPGSRILRAVLRRPAPGTVARVDLRPSRPGPICGQT